MVKHWSLAKVHRVCVCAYFALSKLSSSKKVFNISSSQDIDHQNPKHTALPAPHTPASTFNIYYIDDSRARDQER